MNNPAGVHNALKMREMFLSRNWIDGEKKHWCRFECDIDGNLIKLDVGSIHPDGFEEQATITYYFKSDGTYHSQVHA